MPTHIRFLTLFIAAGLLTAAAGGRSEGAQTRRPNIVFVLTDDQRWDQLSVMGHPFLKTPHIDRLAREGALFTNAFVTTSLCSPSRASFLSGLYAHSHGVISNFTDYPREIPSYPRLLKESGYSTAYIGKWHMGEDDDSPRPGFDHWISHRGQGEYRDNEWNINGRRRKVPGYYTTVVTDMAVDYLTKGRPADRPFCLIVGHKAPHTPYTPDEPYRRVYDDVHLDYPHSAYDLGGKPAWIRERLDTWHGIYGPLYGYRQSFPDRSAPAVADFERFVRAINATLLSVDDSTGRIYEALRAQNLLENTIFVFAGDNGALLGEHGMTDKRTMHEPSIRIPLVVRYPPAVPANRLISRMVLNIDLAPSLLELCGAPPPATTQGRSFVPLFRNPQAPWRSSFLYEYNYEAQFPYTPNVRGVRTDDWKYIRYPHGDGGPDRHLPELYNLREDPGELRNLAADPRFAGRLVELRAELSRLLAETGAQPDRMPLDEGIKARLPEAAVR